MEIKRNEASFAGVDTHGKKARKKPLTTAELFNIIFGILKEKGLVPDILEYWHEAYDHIPLSLFLSSCGLPPCQKPFYLLFFPASCKISSFFNLIDSISHQHYLIEKVGFMCIGMCCKEICIIEIKNFINC